MNVNLIWRAVAYTAGREETHVFVEAPDCGTAKSIISLIGYIIKIMHHSFFCNNLIFIIFVCGLVIEALYLK